MRACEGRLGLASLAVVAACVPVETIEIPNDVDWVVALGQSVGPLEDGRPYAATEVDIMAPQGASAWLLGYTDEQLTPPGLPDALLRRSTLRWAEPGERHLPDAKWKQPLSDTVNLRDVTTDWLLLDPDIILGGPGGQLTIDEVEIRVPFDSIGGFNVGSSDNGTVPVVLSGHTVVRLTEDGPVVIGQHNCSFDQSIAESRNEFWITTRTTLCRGQDISSLVVVNAAPDGDFYRFDGRLSVDRRGTLWFINGDRRAERLTENFAGFDPSSNGAGFRVRVKTVSGDAFIATGAFQPALGGDPWSFRQAYDGTQQDIFFRYPFAGLGQRIIYRTGLSLSEATPSGPVPFADGTTSRAFESISDLESYGGGVLVLESTGHLSWVNAAGIGTDVAFLSSRPSDIVVVGRTVIGMRYGLEEVDGERIVTFTVIKEKK